MAPRLRIGIDLGGTKIEGAAVDGSGVVVVRRRIATPRGSYRATLEALVALVGEIEMTIGETASVGIGMPGAIFPITGVVKNANSRWLIGRPSRQDLETKLRRPVRLANDANCFALSEATDGAAAAMKTVFGVILGTGVGGGIVIGGQIVIGANAIAGEWGHNQLPWLTPEESPGPAVPLRSSGVHRDVSLGTGARRGSLSPYRPPTDRV